MVVRWLITGGCGFIGTSLLRGILKNTRDEIVIMDNLSVGTKEDLAKVCEFSKFESRSSRIERVKLLVGDVRVYDSCLKAVEGVDIVVHLAANTGVGPSVDFPSEDFEVNARGLFNILESCRKSGVTKFVFASSGAPAGNIEPPIHEEIAPHPASPYGASKLAGEAYCSAYYHTFDIATVALRFGNVFGPGSRHKQSVIAKFINKALAGEMCEIYGDGKQTRDFVFIGDLVEAIMKAANYQGGGEIFQIASGGEYTLNEVVSELHSVLIEMGVDLQYKHGANRLGDVRRSFADTSKAQSLLGWKPAVSFREGLRLTVQDFLA